MKKNRQTFMIIMTSLILLVLLGLAISSRIEKPGFDKNKESTNEAKYELETILKSSTKFKDSTLKIDEKKETITIDAKYEISIKQGSYMMKIEDKKNENGYCDIVDSIETYLGHPENSSIETCKKTLEGAIALGGISAEIYDNYKILSVNANEPANLYDPEREHVEGELIPLDEINYTLLVNNALFTSMTNSNTNELNTFSLCGHVYNSKKKTQKFDIRLYDSNKKLLKEKQLNYKNENSKYFSFCLNFDEINEEVKYYGIEETK